MTKRTQILFRGIIVSVTLILLQMSLHAQAPNWDSVYADYFIKYQPVDTPAWLFPICFKDYNGEWDTVFIGHDPNATSILDTVLGEIILPLDTSKLAVHLRTNSNGDSILKVDIENLSIQNYFNIGFNKGNMPLTMYWDDSLFYSDSLPFPDLDPLPRARGELWCSDFDPQYFNCPTGFPIVLTDNPDSISPPFPPLWWASDSIFFDGDNSGYMGSALLLYIVPYNMTLDGIEAKNNPELNFNFYPNPVSNELNIKNKKHLPFMFTLFDYLGHQIIFGKETKELMAIDLSKLPNGIYFIKIELDDKSTFLSKRIIKTN